MSEPKDGPWVPLFRASCSSPGCGVEEPYTSSRQAEESGWVLWEHEWLCPECWAREQPE